MARDILGAVRDEVAISGEALADVAGGNQLGTRLVEEHQDHVFLVGGQNRVTQGQRLVGGAT